MSKTLRARTENETFCFIAEPENLEQQVAWIMTYRGALFLEVSDYLHNVLLIASYNADPFCDTAFTFAYPKGK